MNFQEAKRKLVEGQVLHFDLNDGGGRVKYDKKKDRIIVTLFNLDGEETKYQGDFNMLKRDVEKLGLELYELQVGDKLRFSLRGVEVIGEIYTVEDENEYYRTLCNFKGKQMFIMVPFQEIGRGVFKVEEL